MRHIIRWAASSALLECPAHEQRIVPVLFVIFAPMTGQSAPSVGSCTSGIGAGVGVGTGVGVGVGVGSVGLNTGFRFGFAAALTATPLFQTSLLPDLMQVYFFPPVVDVAPALVHLAPAFTAANDGAEIKEIATTMAKKRRERFMAKRYQSAIPN